MATRAIRRRGYLRTAQDFWRAPCNMLIWSLLWKKHCLWRNKHERNWYSRLVLAPWEDPKSETAAVARAIAAMHGEGMLETPQEHCCLIFFYWGGGAGDLYGFVQFFLFKRGFMTWWDGISKFPLGSRIILLPSRPLGGNTCAKKPGQFYNPWSIWVLHPMWFISMLQSLLVKPVATGKVHQHASVWQYIRYLYQINILIY